MSRDKTLYSCAECGGTTPKWLGQCPHCRAWNTLTEALAEPATALRIGCLLLIVSGVVGLKLVH